VPDRHFNDVDGNHLCLMLSVVAPTSVTSQFRIEKLRDSSVLNAIQQVHALQCLLVIDLKNFICFASEDLSTPVRDDLHTSVFMMGSSSSLL